MNREDPVAGAVKRWSWIMPMFVALMSGAASSFLIARDQLATQNVRIEALERDISTHVMLPSHPGVLERIEATLQIYRSHIEADVRSFDSLVKRIDRTEDRVLLLERAAHYDNKGKSRGVPEPEPPPKIAEKPNDR